MNPLKIEFQAFGPFPSYEMVDFKELSSRGLFLICGKTGSGKTTILDAITFALYGKSSGHDRDDFEALRCTKADFKVTTYVKFEFESNGSYYIFERRLEPKRKRFTTSYNLMQREENGEYRVLFENPKEKQLNDKAREIIGLSYDQFRQVIVLPQGQFERLLTSKSNEKEEILTNIFGEEKWQLIADRIWQLVEERRVALKEKQDKIATILSEENCAGIGELKALREAREAELSELKSNYEKAGYEKIIKDNNEALSLVARFKDLEGFEKRLKEMEEKAEERQELSIKLKDSIRAAFVMDFINREKEARENVAQSDKRLKKAGDDREKAIISRDKALKDKESHSQREGFIKEKIAQKHKYEEKIQAYTGLEELIKEKDRLSKDLNAAVKARDNAGRELSRQKESIDGITREFERLTAEHKELLDAYISGIKGELAKDLKEGEACPVCGSTIHPRKAVLTKNSVSREAVDDKKQEADREYDMLQKAMSLSEELQKKYNALTEAASEAGEVLAAAAARAAAVESSRVEGIGTLAELNRAIQETETLINDFEKQGERINLIFRESGEALAVADKALENVISERDEAVLLLKKAREATDKALEEKGFAAREEAMALHLSKEAVNDTQIKITSYDTTVKNLGESIKALEKELEGRERPDEDSCRKLINEASGAKSEYDRSLGRLSAVIKQLKNKEERIASLGEGIEEEIRLLEEDTVFARSLRGDSGIGLSRYVLGIMFSFVVNAANRMLSMVHGGRYRLFRSDEKVQGTNKKGLDLKVFDNQSSLHSGRFVSTLSGGEKFLASLALSIGLSEVAGRGGIKINALFIDEGFGSLDEESVCDAMDVLNSIKEANGLVGIISHVGILQERIPSKLLVKDSPEGSEIVASIG